MKPTTSGSVGPAPVAGLVIDTDVLGHRTRAYTPAKIAVSTMDTSLVVIGSRGKDIAVNHRHSRDAITSRLRLRGYDYSSPGTYFVTICSANRANLFGEIHNGEIIQSSAGVVIESWWHSIPCSFSGVLLDVMIVMPNHVHGLVSIGVEPDTELRHSLSDIMSWLKSRTTHDYILGLRTEGWPPFPRRLWQEKFYEHIVRSDASFERIQKYILVNPGNWPQDENNVKRIVR